MTLVVDWFVHVYKTFDFRNKKADLRIFHSTSAYFLDSLNVS